MEKVKAKIGLFYTCLVDVIKPNVAFAAIKLIEQSGCIVEVPQNQTCCGRPAYNSGDRQTTIEIAKQQISLFENYDYVVGPSGSCMAMFSKHYPELLKHEPIWYRRAKSLGDKSYELLYFLSSVVKLNSIKTEYQGTATYHDSCTGLRELGIKEQPRKLLSQVKGLTLSEMETSEICCGFGGSFSVKYPEISSKMTTNKVEDILSAKVDTLLGGDLGCLMNIAGRIKRMNKKIKVYHTAEVLAGMTEDGPLGGR